MTIEQAISIGAYCQSKFQMDPGFKVTPVPIDGPQERKVIVHKKPKSNIIGLNGKALEPVEDEGAEFDTIKLEPLRVDDKMVAVGYSKKANILLIGG